MIKVRSLPEDARFYIAGVPALLEVFFKTPSCLHAKIIDPVTNEPVSGVDVELSYYADVELHVIDK